jgi:UDP-glucuronate decarboxylase
MNLGNPGEFTMIELARLVERHAGKPVKLEHRALPKDDPTRRQPDIALARKELGWQPTVPLEEGIVRTIEWFRSINLADYPPPSPYVMQPEAQAAR